jgi:ABC-type Fe3+/spermidine/putrescine transport system ATPase subunit
MIYSTDISARGSSCTIRKFAAEPISPIQLIKWGTFSPEFVAYVWLCLENKMNIILAGETASGKTTALKALVGELVPEEGTIRVNGTMLTGPPRARVLQGVVGTQQTTAVFPELTALQNALVGAGLRLEHDGPFRTAFRTPKARADERVAEEKALGALHLVGLHEPDRPAEELTAHEQRLLMLASAVVLPTLPMLAIALVHVTLMNLKARNEEAHLAAMHGADYARYAARTGRFVPRFTTREP